MKPDWADGAGPILSMSDLFNARAAFMPDRLLVSRQNQTNSRVEVHAAFLSFCAD